MRIDIVTLFPEMFSSFLDGSLLGAARRNGLIDVRVTNIRDFAEGVHRQVDDRPYGGGPGMLLMPGPVVSCVEAVRGDAPACRTIRTILMAPAGRRLDQALVEELAGLERIVLVCGRYEGFDARIGQTLDAETLSIGDYVLSGGEVAAAVVIDAVARLVPGVVGNRESLVEESFSEGLLEYPQYTRPEVFRGSRVPDVLLSGHHGDVARWRHEQSLATTRAVRPDLLADRPGTEGAPAGGGPGKGARRRKGRERIPGGQGTAASSGAREDAGSADGEPAGGPVEPGGSGSEGPGGPGTAP
ncbi:tRNA (guanosine(37)-N1)-methyltransferase TrmD [bacterium]|nr:tRNA (guanosine(37)-N1)-methyltransferase TrmD [bacterium]